MTPANDNTPRPAAYDAQLIAHTGFLKMIASKFVAHRDRDELIQDTCVYALRRWSLYNPDFKFTTWLSLQMKNVLHDRAARAAAEKRTGRQVNIDKVVISVPAEQENACQRNDVFRALPDGREGEVLRRRLLGDNQQEIAVDFGVSASRVQQIEARGLNIMRKRLGRLPVRRVAA